MLIKNFIRIIIESGELDIGMTTLTEEICASSEINRKPDVIKKWFTNGKSGRTPRYPGIINRKGFVSYLKRKTEYKWKDIQQAFGDFNKEKPLGDIETFQHIDTTTNNIDIFYNSLLDQFYYLLKSAPITLKHIPPSKNNLIGRSQELEEIDKLFMDNNIVVLTGVGGIGKSYLASAYSHKLNINNEYTIQQVFCDDVTNIEEAVLKLKFENLKESGEDSLEAKLSNRIEALKNNLKPVIIILDNVCCPAKTTDFSCISMKTDQDNPVAYCQHVRFIVTTRYTRFSSSAAPLYIEALQQDELMSLYATHRFRNASAHEAYLEQNKETLSTLFSLVQNHTLIITLLAKLVLETGISETQLLNQLLVGLKLPLDAITISKDQRDYELSIYDILKVIFDLSNLSTDEINILTYLSLIPIDGIDRDTFYRLSKTKRSYHQALVNKHWITVDEENFRIHLHPLICETIINCKDTRPSLELTQSFSNIIKKEGSKYTPKDFEFHIYSKIMLQIATKVTFAHIRDFRLSAFPDVPFFSLIDKNLAIPLLYIQKVSSSRLNYDISKAMESNKYYSFNVKKFFTDNGIDIDYDEKNFPDDYWENSDNEDIKSIVDMLKREDLF